MYLRKSIVLVAAIAFGSPATAEPYARYLSKRTAPHGCEIKRPEDPRARRASGATDQDGVTAAIQLDVDNIRKLRDEYSCEIDYYQREQTAFDSSSIALGIGAVAAAFFKATVPAIGGISIAATGLDQYRSYYKAEGIGGAYIRAVSSARCISSTAEPLLASPPQELWSTIAKLKLAIVNVEVSSFELGKSQINAAPAAAALATTKSDSMDAATKALDAAELALKALQDEAAAYNEAPGAIDDAHDRIKDYIDLQRHRATPDFGALETALNNGIDKAKDFAAATLAARSALLEAVKGQATAQAGAVKTSIAPDPSKAPAPPVTLDLAKIDPRPTVVSPTSAVAAVETNSGAILALIEATKTALLETPNPQFTTINLQIRACTAGL